MNDKPLIAQKAWSISRTENPMDFFDFQRVRFIVNWCIKTRRISIFYASAKIIAIHFKRYKHKKMQKKNQWQCGRYFIFSNRNKMRLESPDAMATFFLIGWYSCCWQFQSVISLFTVCISALCAAQRVCFVSVVCANRVSFFVTMQSNRKRFVVLQKRVENKFSYQQYILYDSRSETISNWKLYCCVAIIAHLPNRHTHTYMRRERQSYYLGQVK